MQWLDSGECQRGNEIYVCFVGLKILCRVESVLEESRDGSGKTTDLFAESSPETLK